MAIQHKNIPEAQLHEVKGASSASAGQILVADGAGSSQFVTPATIMGWWDYNDLATATTPINLTLASTDYPMTNDGAGPFTNLTYALDGAPNIWNTSTGVFDFSVLELGDTVGMRIDLEITTSGANHEVIVALELAQGGSPYKILWDSFVAKSAGVYRTTTYNKIYMGDNNTLNNPAQIVVQSDSTGDSVKVNGWFVEAQKRSSKAL